MIPSRPLYAAVLIPALQRIQHEIGYLKREALEEFSKESGVPLYRLQAVASFFPHFQFSPPAKVTLHVCQDMACHLAGSEEILRNLASLAGENVTVKGVSCLGRCDRAPAACVAFGRAEHECHYHGRSADELKKIVEECLRDQPPKPDLDLDHHPTGTNWAI